MRLGTIAISSIAAVAIIALAVYLAMSGMAEADHGQSPHRPCCRTVCLGAGCRQ